MARPTPLPRAEALARAADAVVRAPAAPGTPWRLTLHPAELRLRADRALPDPAGRARVQHLGAALLRARVAVAAAGSAVRVERLPDPADPGLVARLLPADGPADAALAALGPALHGHARRRSARPAAAADLRPLAAAAAAEDTVLVPVTREEHRRLLGCPAQPPGGTLVLLATADDDAAAWLRCGEALERVLLELTARGLDAGPLAGAVDVPLTRTQLRSGLVWDAHPQAVLRIGSAPVPAPVPAPAPRLLAAAAAG